MSPELLTVVAPVILAAFLASIVEVVEAFTIILAVGTTRGWRPALAGTAAAQALVTRRAQVLNQLRMERGM